jgi:hypothetical protein
MRHEHAARRGLIESLGAAIGERHRAFDLPPLKERFVFRWRRGQRGSRRRANVGGTLLLERWPPLVKAYAHTGGLYSFVGLEARAIHK